MGANLKQQKVRCYIYQLSKVRTGLLLLELKRNCYGFVKGRFGVYSQLEWFSQSEKGRASKLSGSV
jgi:hypothetical protein